MKTKEIQKIYQQAVDYLNGNNSISIHNLIEECEETIKDMAELNELHEALCVHINMLGVDTLEEQCERAELLIEEITGYLGRWLDEWFNGLDYKALTQIFQQKPEQDDNDFIDACDECWETMTDKEKQEIYNHYNGLL